MAYLAISALLGVGLPSGGALGGETATVVGIDVDTAGNDATSLGTIENCRTVQVGDTFDVDVFVKDVPKLTAFQGWFQYDPEMLEVIEVDESLFLAAAPQSNVASLSQPGGPGTHILGAADFGPEGVSDESGSGVLARITLKGVRGGQSPATLSEVALARSEGGETIPIQPANEEGYFVGPLQAANIAVGQVCTPSLSPTTTPGPGEGAGLGLGLWLVIALGSAAAVGLGGAGGWYLWRRRSAAS